MNAPRDPARPRVLLVDDEESMREFLEIGLRREGYEVETAVDGLEALKRLESGGHAVDLVITDLTMPGCSGLDVLRAARQIPQGPTVIMITAFATTDTAVEAMKLGAYDYLVKPFKSEEFMLVVARAIEERHLRFENQALRSRLRGMERLDRLIARSPSMQQVFELVRKVAPSRANVLITGESGTGKELVARALHAESDRAAAPFLAINCGAIPAQLIESELFGHLKGSFTGAHADHAGLFRACGTGTLFLDEIGEMEPSTQVKLLRVLQERQVRPLGSSVSNPVECRVVAATNQDLERSVNDGSFRKDLYFRLNVVPVELPPLRARKEDIPVLADAFFERFNSEQGDRLERLSPEAYQHLMAYDFPGNVRELENIIERAVTLTSGSVIGPEYLPAPATCRHRRGESPLPPDGLDPTVARGRGTNDDHCGAGAHGGVRARAAEF